MSSSSTSKLGLFKATPGTAEPFRTADLNSNWDKLDVEASSVDSRLDAVEADGWVVSARIGSGQVTNAKIDSVAGSKVSGTVGDSMKWGGRTLFVSSSEPVGAVSGDVWFKTA